MSVTVLQPLTGIENVYFKDYFMFLTSIRLRHLFIFNDIVFFHLSSIYLRSPIYVIDGPDTSGSVWYVKLL